MLQDARHHKIKLIEKLNGIFKNGDDNIILVYFEAHLDCARDNLMVTNWNFISKLSCDTFHVKRKLN